MRPNNDTTHANIGGARSETRFALHADSTAHLVGVLTNLYSDRLLAFVRELSTNALDSHIVAKSNAPIRVTLPSAAKPNFAVEDFGLGLSIDDLETVYTQYGASTKRDSDEVNGVLGLGCKAPLAYADTFTIRARKGGVQVLAVVAKDADGVPVLRVLDTAATDQPNGVRIEVPVRQFDFNPLQRKVENFFSYWEKGSVLVNGQQPASIRDDETLIWLDDDVAVSAKGGPGSVIVQHNVAYPVDYSHDNLPFIVIAYVPSGTVNFPPSREALEYTERTEDVLKTLDEYATERFDAVIRERVAAAKTTYERLVLVQEWRQYVPKVVQEFFGKYGLRVSLGSHGFGWRYRPFAYNTKASKVESLSPHDLIGEFPIITGYPLKSLSPKNKAKIDRYFEGKGHKEYLCLPPGTSLNAIIGRDEVHEWGVIDAATPTVKAPGGSTYKGQTQYTIWYAGDHSSYTLKEAKDLIAETEATVLYVNSDGGSISQWLPDAVVFEIKSSQESKIIRETGADFAWPVLRQHQEAARKALTDVDIFKAKFSTHHYPLSAFVKEAERVEDPEVRQVLEILAAPKSKTMAAFENLGCEVWDLRLPEEDATLALARVTAQRYPLIERANLTRQDVYDDALTYINAKYQQTSASADGSTTSLNPAKEQS